MMKKYDHNKIEAHWRQKWVQEGIYTTPDVVEEKENFYMLTEFSYPSGDLHVGHWYAFAVSDIFARYKRMQGNNVLFPVGFDSFGLPAENAAIKHGLDPRKWTYENMEYMKKQLESMGAMFEWNRAIATSNPDYYQWTQWMFTKFFENDLAYRASMKVNWCISCKTVLANEQVVDGHCERCGNEVEQRDQEQWMLRITKFADQLHDDLDQLDWPEEIKAAQRAWIGRSEGVEIQFKVNNEKSKGGEYIIVFTTRPDTIFGATYLVLAPEHAFVAALLKNKDSKIKNQDEVQNYIDQTKKKSDLDRQQSKEKTGVELRGVTVVNPANGEEIPVWIADYVLDGYGTGAVMAVPAHDKRDFEFAEEFGLNVCEVVDENNKLINSDKFDGLGSEEARQKITEYVGGKMKKTYRLRDWGISRQRYWGCPIPIVYDPEGKPHPVPEENLPWELPGDVDYIPDGTAPLVMSVELKKRTEEIFGKGWTPEVETMDTFLDSAWYFYRYLDPKNEKEFCSKEMQEKWMPIDLYMGGAEHTTMHLLYSRFWNKALHELGYVTEAEPYKVRRNRGLILGPDGNKMSKSKGNVINPDEQVQNLGADTVRMYLAFLGPYGTTTNFPWNQDGVVGIRRFIERVWRLGDNLTDTDDLNSLLHRTIQDLTKDMEKYKFNTAISKMMIFSNKAEQTSISKKSYTTFIRLLAPFAPHITEEIWREVLGNNNSIHLEPWPEHDELLVQKDTVELPVQVNGKVRTNIEVDVDISEEELKELVMKNITVQKWVEQKEVKKFIYITGKIVNIVI
jgi:leucyl-tRNA synthetase